MISDPKTFKLLSTEDRDAIDNIVRHIEIQLVKDRGDTKVHLRNAPQRLVRCVATRYQKLGWHVRLFEQESGLVLFVSHPDLTAVQIEFGVLDLNAVREVDVSTAPASTE